MSKEELDRLRADVVEAETWNAMHPTGATIARLREARNALLSALEAEKKPEASIVWRLRQFPGISIYDGISGRTTWDVGLVIRDLEALAERMRTWHPESNTGVMGRLWAKEIDGRD